MLRRIKRRPRGRVKIIRLVAAAGLIPALSLLLYTYLPLLIDLTCKIAIFSAALAMPDAGLDFFEQRFHDEIYSYGGVEDNAHSVALLPHQPRILPPNHAREEAATVQPSLESSPEAPRETTQKPVRIPRIPNEYAAELISESFARSGGTLIAHGAGHIKNETKHSNDAISKILKTAHELSFVADDRPQVLIMHTHATESFEKYDSDIYDTRNTWRSTDNNNNMVAVGNVMAEVLEGYGIGVLHDTTQHDYPSYNGSYERSAKTVQRYLEEYPDIKIVLDLHRDAMARGDAIVKPVTEINGKKAAQIMIISGCDDGTMNMSNWRENLKFAAELQSYIEEAAPQLTRPVYFCYRKYNQDLTTGSLLLEFGSNANTLEEASYSAELAGHALAELILDYS